MKRKLNRNFSFIPLFSLFFLANCNYIHAQKTADDLAKQLTNPVADLISVPFQFNFDFNINSEANGGNNGYKMFLNFQPVIPVSLGKKWNLINRTIVPVITQKDVTELNQKQEGIGDILYTGFLSPVGTKVIWGIGPAISIPTATNELLGSKKLSMGPSIVILAQPGTWTLGGLFTQSWSVTGDENRPDISTFYSQPFLYYGFGGGFQLGVMSENTYDWKNKRLASGMIALTVTQVIQIAGKQMGQVLLAPKMFYGSPYSNIPKWGARAGFILAFPK